MGMVKTDLRLFSVTAEAPKLVGTWQNELGSVMTIERFDGNVFYGSYTSKVSEKNKPVVGTLVGTVAGDTLGFMVNWAPTFQSVTSWSGKILAAPDGAATIYTLWQLSQGLEDEADWWQSFLAGSDYFWPTK